MVKEVRASPLYAQLIPLARDLGRQAAQSSRQGPEPAAGGPQNDASPVFRGLRSYKDKMAERGGFEPPNEVDPRYAISSRARSTAPAPLRVLALGERRPQGYDTAAVGADRLPAVLAQILAANAAFSKDVGLIVTFIGIGILVNIIVVLIAVLVRGERQQNREQR